MNALLTAAAALGLVTFVVHTFVGGPRAAGPLLASTDITRASRWLNYFCWQIVTVLLLIMAAALAFGAMGRLSGETLALVAVIAASISIISVAVTLKAGIAPLRFPASYLLAGVALLTALGLA